MSANYQVRKISEDDYAKISALIEQVARKFLFHEYTEEGKNQFLLTVTGQGIVNNVKEGTKYWVAEIKGEIIGVIAFKKVSHLYNLFIAEHHQGKGVAKKLWLETTKNQYVQKYTIFASSTGVPFYQKLGFHISGEPTSKKGIFCIPMELVASTN